MIKQLLPMLLRDGHVTRSALGIRINDVREIGRSGAAATPCLDTGVARVENACA